MKKLLYILLIVLYSCEEVILLDLDTSITNIVVEGYIEPALPVHLFLSRSQPFFDDINEESINNLFVQDADIIITRDDGEVRKLTYISQDLLDSITSHYSIDRISLPFHSIYLDLNPYFENFNLPNHYYKLDIKTKNKHITSSTFIPPALDIDSVWCECEKNKESIYDCYIWSLIQDPDTLGNILYAQYKRYDGENIDNSFRICSRFLRTDKLWNGTSYSTYFSRSGTLINEEGNGGLLPFKSERVQDGETLKQDKVIFKISQINNKSYLFLRSKKIQEELNNNPFSEPNNVVSNIKGGLGTWSGYGALYYDISIQNEFVTYHSVKPDIFDIFLIE